MPSLGIRVSELSREWRDTGNGHQEKWLAALRQRTADWFTGTVRLDPLLTAPPPARGIMLNVTFEPGAARALAHPPAGPDPHRHGRLRPSAALGRSDQEIRPGDVVWIAPGKKHWHGAAPATAMAHIAVYEALDGHSAEWMEEVSEEQYQNR